MYSIYMYTAFQIIMQMFYNFYEYLLQITSN